MASPFKVFRKHQKVWLAGLTILAMFSFVFLGTISDLLGTRSAQNPVVVRTSKYGKLTQRDLAIMQQDKRIFLQTMANIYARAANLNPEICRRIMEYNFGGAGSEDVVNTWLRSQRAKEIGMVVSNKTINAYLQNFTAKGTLTESDISAIIMQQGLSDSQFFDIMRDQLRAWKVAQMFEWSLQGITPAKRWEYFCQLRKQATVELIPVDVEQFLDRVKDPGEEDLKALFEKYKNLLPNPNSPEPGFRIPHRIEVRYFKAELAKFSDPAAITDEEIQSAYEKNRDYFDKLEKESAGPPAAEKKGAEEKDKPATEEKKEETKKEETKKEDAQKSSALDRSPFTLTALAEQAEKPTGEQPKTEKSAAESAKTEKPAAEPPKTEKPAAEPPKTEKPAAEPPKTDNSPAAEAKSENPTAGPQTQPEKAEKTKHALSEKMKDRIRAQIAREKISNIMLQLAQKMEENGKKWRKYEAEKINKKATAPPPDLDFEALAKQFGVSAGQTGLISDWESRKFDIGSSYVGEALSPFAVAAFKSLNTYRTESAMDIDGNSYLFWKTNDVPESEPSLTDKNVRQEVIRAWKMIEARQLARKRAESMAEEAAKSGATLKGALPDVPQDRVITPPPFSMFTEGSVPRGSSSAPPRLSEVEGVPLVGIDFMRAVFNLDINRFGVAINAPQTVVYVVQLVSYNPPQDALWQIFLAEDFSKYSVMAGGDLQEVQKQWMESLKTSAGLQWEIKPEQSRGESAPTPIPED
jgi:hypothetical protein